MLFLFSAKNDSSSLLGAAVGEFLVIRECERDISTGTPHYSKTKDRVLYEFGTFISVRDTPGSEFRDREVPSLVFLRDKNAW